MAMALDAPAVQARLETEGLGVERITAQVGSAEDAAQVIQIARQVQAAWVVLDGYRFTGSYQQALKDAGVGLVCIDDEAKAEHYYADVILNQNLHADTGLYSEREAYTRLLLSTRYALLRREFRQWRGELHVLPQVARRVLVTLGGADPDNSTIKVIQALAQVSVPNLEALVIIGGSNAHAAELEAAARESGVAMQLVCNVPNMPDLMAGADVCVSASGSTVWELAYMGVPSIVLVVAANQAPLGEQLHAQGAMINLGRSSQVSAEMIAETLNSLMHDAARRNALASRSRELVDGQGAARVVAELISSNSSLSLRSVCTEDCRLIWEWANDPEVRAVSFSTEPIPWETHVKWFAARVQDSDCHFDIAGDGENCPIGQIRYEVEGDEAVVSLSLARHARGKGYGSQILTLGAAQIFNSLPVRMIHAYVKLDNAASRHTFAKAGFVNVGVVRVGQDTAIHFVLKREEEK